MSWLSKIFSIVKADSVSLPESSIPIESNESSLTTLQQLSVDHATRLMTLVNESMLIARDSRNPETKISRLTLANEKLTQLKSITQESPFIKILGLDAVESQLISFESEFSKAGHYANSDVSSLNGYRQDVWRGTSIPVEDIITGWQFCAAMQLRTPLRVISRHNEICKNAVDPPNIAKEQWEGIWIMKTKSLVDVTGIPELELPEASMASSVGCIQGNGGEFIKFLKSVRRIVEKAEPTESRMSELRSEFNSPKWGNFIQKLGGKQTIYDQFFPSFLDTIPGLTKKIIEAMWSIGLTTPKKISAITDDDLVAIKGIGAAKLIAIRSSCIKAEKQDSEYVDRVAR